MALPKDTDGPQWAPLWVSSEERDRVARGGREQSQARVVRGRRPGPSRLDVDLAGHLRGTARRVPPSESTAQLDNGELAVLLTSHDVPPRLTP
ncbi:hypothetical protein LT493_44265 [Streptomyces tricolor]|nr:hypothetical protein [Streptomyces tricolor]